MNFIVVGQRKDKWKKVATSPSLFAGATMTPHLIPLISAFIKSLRGDVESGGGNEWTTAEREFNKSETSAVGLANRRTGIFAEEIITARPLLRDLTRVRVTLCVRRMGNRASIYGSWILAKFFFHGWSCRSWINDGALRKELAFLVEFQEEARMKSLGNSWFIFICMGTLDILI